MKKIFAFAAAIVAAFALIACGNAATGNTEETKKETVAEETKAAGTDATDTADTEETEAYTPIEMPDNYGTAKLSDYKGVEVNVDVAPVTDDDVQTEINNALASYKVEITDRAAKLGDTCVIDYVGKKDGVAFDGGTGSKDLVLGSHTFIDGFEDGLVGVKPGDVVDLNLTFPENYQSTELAGKDVVFTVTVNKIMGPSELTDSWVKDYTGGECNNIAEFKDKLRSDLEKYAKETAEEQAKNQIMQKIVDSSEFVADEEALEYEYQQLYESYCQYVALSGMTIDSYCQTYGVSEDDLRAMLKKYAQASVSQRLVIDGIAKKENITVTEDDLKETAEKYGVKVEDLITYYGEKQAERTALTYKVMQFLYDNANKVSE